MENEPTNPQMLPTLYDRFKDPLDAIERMAAMLSRCGFCGVEKPEQGEFLAWTCQFERKSPLEIARKYHIYDGQLAPKTRSVLADFRKAGGDHEWLTQDDDAEKATIRIKLPNGRVCDPVTYTIEQAKASLPDAMFKKAGSAWLTNPASMLQVTAIRRAISRYCPEYALGDDPDPEAIVVRSTADAGPLPPTPDSPPQAPPAAEKPKKTKEKKPDGSVTQAKEKAPVVDAEEVPPPAAEPPPPPPPPPPPASKQEQQQQASFEEDAPQWSINTVTEGAKNGVNLNAAAEKAIANVMGPQANEGYEWLLRKGWLEQGQTLASLSPARAVKILTEPSRFREIISK